MTKLEQRIQIAIETKNFTTTKRYPTFHRAIAKYFESTTGYFAGCITHHIDENPCNNHPSNLKCLTRSEHSTLHKKGCSWTNESKSKIKGRKVSEETKSKIRSSILGKPSKLKGTNISEEHKNKLIEYAKTHDNAFLGHKHSEETKLKFACRKHSEETKLKMSMSAKCRHK